MNRHETPPNGIEGVLPAINVGLSGSGLIATAMRQIRLAQASGNSRTAFQAGMQHLEQRGLINGAERRSLARMCDLAMVANAGGKRGPAAVERLQRLHDELVVTTSGPAAVAVAGAIVQHFASHDGGPPAQRLGPNPAAGVLGAVIVGGVIGGLAGGLPGVLIGVVGGAVGALTDCSGSD